MPEIHQAIDRDLRTLKVWNHVDGSLQDATSVLLSDPTGAYGIRRRDTLATSVADATAFTQVSRGYYEYEFDPPVIGVEYEAQLEITQTTGNVDRATLYIPVRGVTDPSQPYVTSANLKEIVPWVDDLLAQLHDQNDFRGQRVAARRWLDQTILSNAKHSEWVREHLQAGRLYLDEQVLRACTYYALSLIFQANLTGGDHYDRLATDFKREANAEASMMLAHFDTDLDGVPETRISLRSAHAVLA